MNRLLPAGFLICMFLLIDLGHATISPVVTRTTNSSEDTTRPIPAESPRPLDADRCDSHIVIGMPGGPGPAGPQGIPGVQGPTGYPGAPGHNGINGSPGAAGSRGLKGDAGEPGERGAVGFPGIQGNDGPPGTPGFSGERGARGRPGSPGAPGERGVPGDYGMPGETGREGTPGVKGNAGLPGPKGVCSCPSRFKGGPPRRPQPRGATSAFSAARTTDLQATDSPVIVTYQEVFSNRGGHFNEDTGIFRCAVAGTYFFTMSIFKSSDEGHTLVQLMHDGDPIIGVIDGVADTEDTATNSVVLDLQAGEKVYLQLYQLRELHSTHHRLTTFSGFLLFEA